MHLEITNAAAAQIGRICNNSKVVRLAITSGGCQGFSKTWDVIDSTSEDDQVWQFENGKLAIDPMSLEILTGATIDYKMNLGGSYFTVDIPTADSTCGCGTSFSL